MAAVGWTGFMLFLLLNISMGKETKQSTVSCNVGQDATLPCKDTKSSCSMVTWVFSSNTSPVIELVAHGKVTDAQRPGRLTVGSDCSLRIKNLNTEDAGRYICRLYHNKDEYTDISAVSLFVGENRLADRSCSNPPLSPSTVSPTNKTKPTILVVSPSTVSPSVTKRKSTTPVVSPSNLSPTDIKIHVTILTAAKNVSSADNGVGKKTIVAVAASCAAVCVGVGVTIVIILIFKRRQDNHLPSSQVKVPDSDGDAYALVDLKNFKQKEFNRKTISAEYATIKITQ